MYIGVQVYIEMYPRKVVAPLKEHVTVIKAGISLMWMRCLHLFQMSAENN